VRTLRETVLAPRRLLRSLLENLPHRSLPLTEQEVAELRADFQSRYHALKLLLAANTKALELMAEMELAARTGQTVGMSFVHAHCTALGVSVLQMVRRLHELAPGKYGALAERVQSIQRAIGARLRSSPRIVEGPLVLDLASAAAENPDLTGPKMSSLARAARSVGVTVPEGFVVSASAYHLLMQHSDLQHEVNRLIQAAAPERTDEIFALSSAVQQLIASASVPREISEAMSAAADHLHTIHGQKVRFAVRSSATDEDLPGASFAGQYRSQLNVPAEHLAEAYRDVVASKYTPQAMHYRLERGLRDDEVAMCVGCMVMVPAVAGGVAYTGHPSDSRDRKIYISSVWGLPKAVVDGRVAADLFVVEPGPPPALTARYIAAKTTSYVPDVDHGIAREPVPSHRLDAPSLTDLQALEVASLALRLERHFENPVDVEWALQETGVPLILQCRPLTQVSGPPAEEAEPVSAPVVVSGGVGASPGVGSGPVFWVRRDSDALGLPNGSVLVVAEPLPRWAALLSRVEAVVAEQGGMAGHLATVAREAGIPALLGLGRLEDRLSNGDLVTVDADRLAVYRGRAEGALVRRPRRVSHMAGSRVHRALLQALEHIAPLNLLDPDAPSFRPENCKTLHDITRFCHEQSVREVFSFGSEHRFPRRAAKQLHYKVPMQWWVLDLEDGFTEEVEGRYITLDKIQCAPMLAVWDGMIAIPWAGPPEVSGRGLASILFEATTNPALGSPSHHPYANQNYFMISRSFMNLQSRFGFHLTQVEALVGEREVENYLSLTFNGGAADLSRRTARVQLIGNILENHGFRIRITEDTLTARLSGLQSGAMLQHLRLLGYLLMHTRQLDMVMADDTAVRYYRSKIDSDLQQILSTS
jgi:pyruvate,water dikinase